MAAAANALAARPARSKEPEDPLRALTNVPRRWELQSLGSAGGWRGVIYGPDGETESLGTGEHATALIAGRDLLERWRWLEQWMDP